MLRLPRPSIGTILCAILFSLSAMLLAAGARTAHDARAQERESRRVVALTEGSRILLEVLLAVRLERARTLQALIAAGRIPPADAALIARQRATRTERLEALLILVRAIDTAAVAKTVDPLRRAHEAVTGLSARIDAALSVPIAERAAATAEVAATAFRDLLDALSATSGAVDVTIPRRDAALARALDIKRAAWITRVAIGGNVARAETAVTRGTGWSEEERLAEAEERGRVAASWANLVEHMDDTLPREVQDAFVRAGASNFEGEVAARRQALRAALSRGQSPGVAIQELRDRNTREVNTIADLAQAALNAMVARAQALAAEAEATLLHTSLFLAASVVLAGVGAVTVFRRVLGPLRAMIRAMRVLASGNVAVEIPARGRRDEIGAMAAAVQVFRDNLVRTRALEADAAEAARAAEAQRRTMTHTLAQTFEAAVAGIVGQVSAAATELQTTAWQMTTTAQETASQSDTVAAAAEEASAGVRTAAAAVEELGTSVQEIGRQVQGSSELARVAVGEADQTAALVAALNASVARVDAVVELIAGIAAQTNLLALNATIEAARAGQAGRGFAVVATEVKELAAQTGRATDEIGRQIGEIRTVTGQAVRAIGTITGRIGEIDTVAAAIAAAVEQQGAATREIVRNVAQASVGTQEVTGNIAGVAQAADQTGRAADHVLTAATALTRQSEELAAEVHRFLAGVRAA
ncbi:HAMP domain-containing methyl-accepting chemotaxis protein [Methylobacterium sp.]|uniref:methyl-accepting chemotaxis protein n=1 Tax=Methylobacterium sp. TaxID=409 RepID=UPI000F9ED029|nr:HAMP domain-containing methyl-accepting chemotaxis protein [Methylobacterium sp.]RUP19231.1 MAG: methyl-accepting chemotaxis protein [Methylobacterium sp.]